MVLKGGHLAAGKGDKYQPSSIWRLRGCEVGILLILLSLNILKLYRFRFLFISVTQAMARLAAVQLGPGRERSRLTYYAVGLVEWECPHAQGFKISVTYLGLGSPSYFQSEGTQASGSAEGFPTNSWGFQVHQTLVKQFSRTKISKIVKFH